MSESDSLTARLKRELLLMKAKAEALEFSVSEKDAEIELLHERQDRQHAQVSSWLCLMQCKLDHCMLQEDPCHRLLRHGCLHYNR